MLFLTRERTTGSIVLACAGVLDDAAMKRVIEAIRLAPDELPLIVDLSGARRLAEHSLRLASELAQRLGPVSFRGSGWADTPHAR